MNKWFKSNFAWYGVVSVALTILCFVLDLVLPRGATPAIGYCLVLVVAARADQEADHRLFLLVMSVVCTALTWLGLVLEPLGTVWWMSEFDRGMVTMVLWMAYILTSQRTKTIVALGHKTRALELTTKELERSNGELASFASVIAHDLRAPLNTIGLFAQSMDDRRTATTEDQRHESIDSIQNEVHHMSDLIQRLLTYGSAGYGDIQRVPCDCEAVLLTVLRNLKSEIEGVSGKITHDPLPAVAADATLMAVLLQNLIENGLKYRSDTPPEVHITAVESDAGYQFSIRDNGIGFPPADSQRVFEPFQQAQGACSRRGGVGLGLATCKRIVERHQGRIWVDSQPGRGSTFHFTIPKEPAALTEGRSH